MNGEDYDDPVLRRHRAERARRELTLAAVRADLEEKPSPAAVRAAARRWQSAIRAIAADITDQRHAAA
jgi:hypothetical protein